MTISSKKHFLCTWFVCCCCCCPSPTSATDELLAASDGGCWLPRLWLRLWLLVAVRMALLWVRQAELVRAEAAVAVLLPSPVAVVVAVDRTEKNSGKVRNFFCQYGIIIIIIIQPDLVCSSLCLFLLLRFLLCRSTRNRERAAHRMKEALR